MLVDVGSFDAGISWRKLVQSHGVACM